MREARYQSDIIAVSCPGRSTLTCAECRVCPNGWTGTETCTGAVACYVSVTARSTRVVDRGCFHNQATVNGLCNQIITETDGTQLHYFCCNESDFCNENTTVTFPSCPMVQHLLLLLLLLLLHLLLLLLLLLPLIMMVG